MKINLRDFAVGGISIQVLRHGDIFVDSDGKPIPDLLIIHKGYVQFIGMDGSGYVSIAKIPPGCDNPTYLLMHCSDIVAMADYMNTNTNVNLNTAEDTDEKIQDL